jgi:trans-aconitate 2-methyltransferase
MPDNLDEPSHVLMRETAADSRFVASIGDSEKQRARILPAGRYYDLLSTQAEVDIWRTTYYHVMDTTSDVVEWLRATGRKVFLDPLTPELREQFVAEYERRVAEAYPPQYDGRRLLTFSRLFFVARRRGER